MEPDCTKMESALCRLFWEDFDGTVEGLKNIAYGEICRKVISTELKEWWNCMYELLKSCPLDCLPHDN